MPLTYRRSSNYVLPDHQTRTVLKTQTHKGEGSNEPSFEEQMGEDEAGEEALYFHAQKDLQLLIENDQSQHILADQHWDVTNNRLTQVTKTDHLTVDADSLVAITKDSTLNVKASHHQKVSKKQLLDVGAEVHLKSKGTLILDAGSEITLSGGGSFLKVNPAGVHLVGSKINLNSGGGAGKGSGVKIKKPEIAMILDGAICPETGEVIKQAATMETTEIEEVEFDYTAVEMVQTQGVAIDNAEGAESGAEGAGSTSNSVAGGTSGVASDDENTDEGEDDRIEETAITISTAGEEFIHSWEASTGPNLEIYPDLAGYGHKLTKAENESGVFSQGITEEEALQLFKKDAKIVEAAILRLVSAPLNQAQFDATASLIFNIGATRFAGYNARKQMDKGNYDAAIAEFADINKARNPFTKELELSEGLDNRRKKEMKLFREGIYENNQ